MNRLPISNRSCWIALILVCVLSSSAQAQTTAFTYQGKLTNAGSPANGNFDLLFKLFDAPTGATGTQQGMTLTSDPVTVTAGVFTVTLDFGANVFNGGARYLEIAVRVSGDTGGYAVLSPRQPINATPYAIQTLNAQQLGGFPASSYLKTDGNGNVGIGTMTPGVRLDVNGAVNATAFTGNVSAATVNGAAMTTVVDRLSSVENFTCSGCDAWSKRFGGTGDDQGYSTALDSNGDIFVTGMFQGTVNFGGGPIISAGGADVFVAKYSGIDGSHIWSMPFGSTNDDIGNRVAVDSGGNIVITGSFSGSVDFGGGTLNSTSNSIDIFVAKYSGNDGSHIWSQRFGQGGIDIGYGVTTDSSGNILVTGYFLADNVTFGGESSLSAGGAPEIFVAKYSSAGAFIWAKRFGGGGVDVARAIAVDGSGNVFITGYFTVYADMGGQDLFGAGASDGFVAKYSGADGSRMWAGRFGGSSDDVGFGLAVDSSGNVLVTGLFTGAVNFGGGLLNSEGGVDIFLAAYSGADGHHLWSKRFGGMDHDIGYGVAVDSSGRLTITGYFQNTVDFGGGPLTSAGGTDVFAATYSTADGAYIWSKSFGSTSDDEGDGVATDTAGNVFLTGLFRGTVDFGSGAFPSAGGTDIFLVKSSLSQASSLVSRVSALEASHSRVTNVFASYRPGGHAELVPPSNATPNFTVNKSGATVVVFAAGSGWATTADTIIGMNVQIDGTTIGQAMIYAEDSFKYVGFVPFQTRLTLSAGNHNIQLTPMSNTDWDANAIFTVTVTEFP